MVLGKDEQCQLQVDAMEITIDRFRELWEGAKRLDLPVEEIEKPLTMIERWVEARRTNYE